MLRFRVNGNVYRIPTAQVENFPLKSALLNLLHTKVTDGSMGVQVDKEGAIIIDYPCHQFNIIMTIYVNPVITLQQLLGIDFLETLADEYRAFKESIKPHGWTDQNIDEETALAAKLHQHHGYTLLGPPVFKILKQDLKFFGLWELFESPLKKQLRTGTATIDPTEIIVRLHEDLALLLKNQTRLLHASSKAEEFVDDMRSIGGYMSGSFVLKHILNEQWPTSDIDIYANESMLKGMMMTNHRYPVGADNHLILHKFFTLENARQADCKSVKGTTDISNVLEAEYAIAMGKMAAKLFKAKLDKVHTRTGLHFDSSPDAGPSIQLDKDAKKPIDHEVYCCRSNAIAEGISAVIKLDLHGVKVDIVIVNVTVPFFIKAYFDFGFNKVFYDGYNITVLDWKAVLNKRCQNILQKGLGSREAEYLVNIHRITKYSLRGFTVQPRQ